MGEPKTHDHIQINIRMPNPSQEPPASSKAPNEDLKDMGVLCNFKIKIKSLNLYHGYVKDQLPYPNQYQDVTPQAGTSNVNQIPKSGLKGHGCSSQLENQEPNFRILLYQRPKGHTKIMISLPNPSQKPQASSKSR